MSTNNPFKKLANNSKETAKKWNSERKDSSVETITCKQCGAPRPANTLLKTCAFCGYQFMDEAVDIKGRRPQ